jgi:hypothetical protein
MRRPYPPQELIEAPNGMFRAAHDLTDWVRETFIDDGGNLTNDEHEHLQGADIGFLWTNIENTRRNRLILGQAALMPPTGDKWSAGRATEQIERWFGGMPDFVITIYAATAAVMDHWQFCALIEHELMHCAQKRDKYGSPMFNDQTGKPVWDMRGHDFEEFTSVVGRYGATSPALAEAVRLANKGPEISEAKISIACGNCLRLVK